MKAFVLLLTLAFASHFVDVESRLTLAQMTNSMKTVKKACFAKTGVSKDLFEATHDGDFAEDKTLMCFFNCAMGMMQTLKAGKFDRATLEHQVEIVLPEDLVEQTKTMISVCSPQVISSDPCEACWQFAKCNFATDKEVYFFP